MLDSASIAMIVGLVFCVIMSGYFSATETAFTSLNRVRLKSWADGGDQRAARTLALAEDYDKLLSTCLSAITSSTTWPPPSARYSLST